MKRRSFLKFSALAGIFGLGASGTLICQSSLEFSNFLLVLVQLGAWAIFGIAVLATSMPKGNVSRIETLREKLKQIGNPTSD